MLLFSTDYPHWHFDGDDALPDGLPERWCSKILVDNPLATYPRLVAADRDAMEQRAMNIRLAMPHRRTTPTQTQLGFVDCDVHPMLELARRLRRRSCRSAGASTATDRQPLARGRSPTTSSYPRMSPGNGMRGDAWPPNGGPPGSDLDLMREQLLDLFDVAYGILHAAGRRRGPTSATSISARRMAHRDERMAGRSLAATASRGCTARCRSAARGHRGGASPRSRSAPATAASPR